MATWAPDKRDTFEALAAEIAHNYGKGRTVIAIDGRASAGTFGFAADLAQAFRSAGRTAFHASMEDFRTPRSERERGDAYTHGYDHSLFRRVLIDPYRTGGSTGFVLTGFDAVRNEPIFQPKWMSAGHDAMLIVDGVFLHRPELAGIWQYSVWLQGAGEPATDRDEVERYIAEQGPSAKATAIYDNSDPEHPRRIFADSC